MGSLNFGSVGVFEFLAASDDYYAWWMREAEGHPMTGQKQLYVFMASALCQVKYVVLAFDTGHMAEA